jgi:NADP-dependent 3-hydroxy acid dehydrogenase YdfG
MESLEGKVVWITGAGSGIGQASAAALAGAGAQVVLSGRREAALAETAKTIEEAGGSALVAPLDVTDLAAVRATAAMIGERFQRLDILVNNAGVNIAERNWANADPAQWDLLVKININGVYYCISAVLPMMRERKDGLIINISSWAGRYEAYLAGAAYSASKHAVLSLNASLNLEECVNGIRACAICPAEVATPILDRRPVPVSAADKARMLQPADLAETILYVARMPARACVNEILISPTWNRFYIGKAGVPEPASA